MSDAFRYSKQTHAEMLKAGGETTVTVLKPIIDRIWENGELPQDWVTSELITIPNVSGTAECGKHQPYLTCSKRSL